MNISKIHPGFKIRGNCLVSIVIPNYNYEKFIGEAIDSAINQNYSHVEVIVVDDASTDGSKSIIESYGAKIKTIYGDINRGQIAAYNAGFEEAVGDIVIFLDSDDRLHRDAVKEIVAAFQDGVAKVHFRAQLVNDKGASINATVPKKLVAGDMSSLLLKKGILYPSPPGSANAYSASALRGIMPIPEGHEKHGADFYTIYGSALVGTVGIAGNGRPLVDYRIHDHAHRVGLNFGNAAQTYHEADRLAARSQIFLEWMLAKAFCESGVPAVLTEFSIEKNTFTNAIFSSKNYWVGWKAGVRHFPALFRSVLYRPSSFFEKLALIGVSVIILMAPRRLGWPVARYLCNPASRGAKF